MQETYNLYNLEAPFRLFLIAEKNSSVTVRNYLSDYRFFLNWIGKFEPEKCKNLTLINTAAIEKFKNYLTQQKLPAKSVNRRLSSLRKFFTFCIRQNWISENPAKKVPNIQTAGIWNKELGIKRKESDSNTAMQQSNPTFPRSAGIRGANPTSLPPSLKLRGANNKILSDYKSHLSQSKSPDINNSMEIIGELINS